MHRHQRHVRVLIACRSRVARTSIGTCVATAAAALLIGVPALAAPPTTEVREHRAFEAAAPASRASPADTAPAEAPIVATNFVFVPGAGSLANLVCAPGLDGAAQLAATLSSLLTGLQLDPQLVVVLATQPLVCGDLFYHPLANDVRGIGYQHEVSGELFDETPDSRLEGMAFLNDFPYWQGHPAEFQKDFNHEIGHRWAARVHALIDSADSTALLGRDLEHWSYFLSTGGSPMEGNIWTDLGDGQYQADTPLGPGTFSDLDLYLMGVLPAADVRSQQLLLPGARPAALDCLGLTLGATSPPQSCGVYETPATPIPFGIGDVIAAEGERDPPPVLAAMTVDVTVVVLGTGTQPFDLASCQAMTDAVPARIADFATASGRRVLLNNLVTTGADCASFTSQGPGGPAPCDGGGCAVAPPAASGWAAALLALATLRSRLSRRQTCRDGRRVNPSS